MGSNYDHFANLSYLVLEANSSCNLRCRFCPRQGLVEAGKRPFKIMTLDEYRSILEQLKTCQIKDIKVHGLSEAMMVPNFDEYLKLIREYFPDANITLVTNNQYPLEKSPLLRSIPLVDSVWLSIDGSGEVLEYLRTGAKWERTVKFLEDLKTLVRAEVRKNKFHIQATVSSINFRELPKIYELKEKYGLCSVRYNLAQEWDGNTETKHKHGNNKELIEFLKQYKDDLKGCAGWEFSDCFWPYEGIFIDAYGDVRHCIMNYTMEAIGNVFEEEIKTIYNKSPVYKKTREALSHNSPPEQCKTCDYFSISSTLKKIHGVDHFNPPKIAKFVQEKRQAEKNSSQ